MKVTIRVLERIVEVAIYCLVFIIPFSKAGIEIFASTAITAWLIKKGLMIKGKGLRQNFLPRTPLNKPVLALFAVSFVSMIFSVNINLGLEGVFLKLAEYLLIFFICADTFSNRETGSGKFKILLGVIAGSAILLFADAGFQWITGKDFIRGYTIGRFRACFSSANDFAGYLIAILPLLFCMAFIKFKKIKIALRLAIRLSCIGLFLIGLVFLGKTSSRGAWMGFLISTLFMGVVWVVANARRKPFASMAIFFFSILLISTLAFTKPVGGRLKSVIGGFRAAPERLYQWKEALTIIEDFPVLGTGPNTYTLAASRYKITGETGYYPHNSYLHMAAEIGILGLTAFLWVLWSFFRTGLGLFCRPAHGKEDILLLGIMGGILAILGQSFFDTNLFALRLVMLFWIMMGVALSIYKHLEFDTAT